MASPILKTKSAVTLKWGIGYTLNGYIVQNHDAQHNAEVAKTEDESGSTVAYSFYNFTKTLKVGGVIHDATTLPAPGDEITVNGVEYLVMPPVSEKRDNKGFTTFELNLERAEDNVIPNA